MVRGAQEFCVLCVGDLTFGEFEGVYPDAMDGLLVVLACGAAHEEPAFGDG